MSGPSRRRVLLLAGGALALRAAPLGAAERVDAAGELRAPDGGTGPRHGLAVYSVPRHPPGFAHFDYVDPAAPRGGEIRLMPSSWVYNQNPLTFNTFNTFILKGDAPPRMELCHATLMVRGLDEPDAIYGHLAESVVLEPGRMVFVLRPGATFSDGTAVTAHDVAFTLRTLREHGHPGLAEPLAGVAATEAPDAATAVVTFVEGASPRLPFTVALFPVLSKAYYETHDFTAATLDVPVTSGPYTVGDFQPGSFVTFRRRADYWGDDTPTGRGHNNFESVRVAFYRERTAGFEAFKSGRITFREEFTAKTWTTEYDFPAVLDGRVKREELPDHRPAGAQGWMINTRRPLFADPRVREALGLCFDFEWTNKALFSGLYRRTPSFFVNSDMMARGVPSADELAVLEPLRAQVAPAVFGPVWTPSTTDGTGRDRAPLSKALALLRAAGWRLDGERLVDAAGAPFVFEYLYPAEPTTERVFQPYARRLASVGIEARLRPVDAAQYQDRLSRFDFDLVTQRYALAPTPQETIRELFTAAASRRVGSNNLAGIADPAVDHLIDTMLAADTRREMVAAARALDRVLRVGHYWVPQWYKASHFIAYWDLFGMPRRAPKYGLPVETTWWAKTD